MKVKIYIGIVLAVLVLAQLIFGGRTKREGPPEPVAVIVVPEPPPPTRPASDDVVGITLGDGTDAVRLNRGESGWTVKNLKDAPADEKAIDTLLHSVLTAYVEPIEADEAVTGLDESVLHLSFRLRDGGDYAPVIGLRPQGEYNRTYARLPGLGDVLLSADVRGNLGVWRNAATAAPNAMDWMDPVILRFNPEDVSAITAVYPDHTIQFTRLEDYSWQAEGYVPGGNWSRNGLTGWIQDLARFTVAGLVPQAEAPSGDIAPSHTLTLRLPGGDKTIRVYANHTGGEGMLVETDDFPGRAYHLPEWRFRKYFRSLPSLFPAASPGFDVTDVRFIDVRRGGETVKISRRDGSWRAVAQPYPLLADRVDRLVRLLAGWHPEDYATPDSKKTRPTYGGPMVEIILANGDVHQYRLAGRHPVFPWCYVTLDGTMVFSVTNAEAVVMFPEFADILDLGKVFRPVRIEDVAEIVLTGEAMGKPLLTLLRGDGDTWAAERDGNQMMMDDSKAWRLAVDILNWPVAGFYDAAGRGTREPAYTLRVTSSEGHNIGIALLPPDERNIPYLTEGGRAYLLDRSDFFNWLGEARLVMDAVDKDALDKAAAEERRLAEEARAAEQALEAERAAAAAAAAAETDAGDGVSGADSLPADEEFDINDLGPQFPDDPAPIEAPVDQVQPEAAESMLTEESVETPDEPDTGPEAAASDDGAVDDTADEAGPSPETAASNLLVVEENLAEQKAPAPEPEEVPNIPVNPLDSVEDAGKAVEAGREAAINADAEPAAAPDEPASEAEETVLPEAEADATPAAAAGEAVDD
ncbi:MAG: DUF4340 domain-containing protein [Planctomycetaceae bacterium]|nr:DUF4340 domain-containing protein [Planctomycetaceae bacterium]